MVSRRHLILFLSLSCSTPALFSARLLEVFPDPAREARFSLGMGRQEINSLSALYILRYSNPWPYLYFRLPGGGDVERYADSGHFRALQLDFSARIRLPGGGAFTASLPFLTFKELPAPGALLSDGRRDEGTRSADPGIHMGDVSLELAAARQSSRLFYRLVTGLKWPSGQSPFQVDDPLMSTGTGSRDYTVGGDVGLRWRGLWLAGGGRWEWHRPLVVDNYLYLFPGRQTVDPGDVLITGAGARLNLFCDVHQQTFLGCTYYYRRQGAETAGGLVVNDAAGAGGLLSELDVYFRREFLAAVEADVYDLSWQDGAFNYAGMLWRLRVMLLFG